MDRSFTSPAAAAVMVLYTLALLLVPNISLAITESYPWLVKVIGVVLPAGLYALFLSINRRSSVWVLWSLPLLAMAGFQMVLLYLYGESIIAIDMFVNMVTTDVGEASELLSNLAVAIVIVCTFYFPVMILAAWQFVRGTRVNEPVIKRLRGAGVVLTGIGAVLMVVAWIAQIGFSPLRQIYPINVMSNMVEASHRMIDTHLYPSTSQGFLYHSHSERADSLPEVYVLILGETCRAHNWQLYGYERETNPRLSQREGLVAFDRALTESNTTHKSVPLILSGIPTEEFGDSIYVRRSLISAFREAGYRTAWLSNQPHNRSFIDFFSDEAHNTVYLSDTSGHHLDQQLLPLLQQELANRPNDKLFVLMHTYGSHFNYRDRYPVEYSYYTPDVSSGVTPTARASMLNAYDNTVRYTDVLIDSVIAMVESTGRPGAVLYLSDHGEDVYDDSRERLLHSSPTPTWWQLYVPLMVWVSPQYNELFPEVMDAVRHNASTDVSISRSVFHTMLSLAGIATPYLREDASIVSPKYRHSPRVYLNDYNEAVPLRQCGVWDCDIDSIVAHGISVD